MDTGRAKAKFKDLKIERIERRILRKVAEGVFEHFFPASSHADGLVSQGQARLVDEILQRMFPPQPYSVIALLQ